MKTPILAALLLSVGARAWAGATWRSPDNEDRQTPLHAHRAEARGEAHRKAHAQPLNEKRAEPPRATRAAPNPARRVEARPAVQPRPRAVASARALIDRRPPPAAPAHDDHGRTVPKPATVAPDHAQVVRDPAFSRNIEARERNEQQRSHYYWHDERGQRYCHYDDDRGTHWYGFYAGPRFYWTRYYGSRWWWYDQSYARWVYWQENHWWWVDPSQTAFIYVNGSYQLASFAGGPAATIQLTPNPPPETAVPGPAPTAAAAPDTFYSADGTRMVQIFGERREAFLYDRSNAQLPRFVAFLGGDTTSAEFSSALPLQVLVKRSDGGLAVFDGSGKPFNR